MSLYLLDGLPGAGKSYVAVNFFLRDVLVNTNRPIATNLPINIDALINDIVLSKGKKFRKPIERKKLEDSIRSRITYLQDEDREVLNQTTGQPTLGDDGKPLVLNEIRNFWYFTKPNSYIALDESADLFNARNYRESGKSKLQTYINHNRHYKDDLLFIAQSYEDLDKQLRKKFRSIYRVTNSINENIFESRWMLGLKWPIQFFIIRGYIPQASRLIEQDQFKSWPNSRGFANYQSFSKPESIDGKLVAGDDATSSDIGNKKGAFKMFLQRAKMLFFMLVFFIALIAGGIWFIYELLSIDSSNINLGSESKESKNVTQLVQPQSFTNTLTEKQIIKDENPEKKNEPVEPVELVEPVEPVEIVIAVTRSHILTNFRRIRHSSADSEILEKSRIHTGAHHKFFFSRSEFTSPPVSE